MEGDVTMTDRPVYNSVHQAPAWQPGVPFTREDMQSSLEHFIQTKNLPLSKFKNLLRTNSAPASSNGNSLSTIAVSTPITPSTSSNASSPSTAKIFSAENQPPPSSITSFSPSTQSAHMSPMKERSSSSSEAASPLNPLSKSESGLQLNLAPALSNLRFSLGDSTNGSESISGSNMLAKRGSDDDFEGNPSKRMKNTNLTVRLRANLSFVEGSLGGTKRVEYQCYTRCPQCSPSTTTKDSKDNAKACLVCNGMGRLLRPRTAEFELPADITKKGTKQVLRGYGHISEDCDYNGDLVIEFEVDDHPFYKRLHEATATCSVTITVVQAVLGAKVYIPRLYSDEKDKIEVIIPAGIQPNEIIVIVGEGYKKSHCKKKRGDIEVSIAVEVPKKLTSDQRDLFEKLFLLESMLHLSSICGK